MKFYIDFIVLDIYYTYRPIVLTFFDPTRSIRLIFAPAKIHNSKLNYYF
jgi:hypothetical protein